jgi:hypothetical protein
MNPLINHLPGVRRVAAAAILLSAVGCSQMPSASNNAAQDPEVQAATVACEQQHASHALTSWAQVAHCEYDVALPGELRKRPQLAGVLTDIWSDKIDLYAKVDKGELTKDQADQKINIETDNRLSIIQSMHEF